MRFLFLLFPLFCNASTILVQSNDVTTIYGESIAVYGGYDTIYKVRNTQSDRFDNTKHIIDKILQNSKNDDNLTLIGFEHPLSIPLFDQYYAEHVKTAIRHYYPHDIHVFCNTLCLDIGTIHKVYTTRQLRKALLDVDGIVVVSMTSLWDEDRKRFLYLDDVTYLFRQSSSFLVSALYRDVNTHLQFWVEPFDVRIRQINSRIYLDNVKHRGDFNHVLDVTNKLRLKAK